MKIVQHLCLLLLLSFIFFDFHECVGGFNHIRLTRRFHHGSHESHPSTYHAMRHPKNRLTHQSVSHSTHHLAHHLTHQSTSPLRHHPTHHPTHHSTHHSTHHTTHHPEHQPTHYPTHHPTHHATHHSTHHTTHRQPNHSTSFPTPHQRRPVSPSHYNYTTRDTGSTALGIYLGYKLGQLSRPSYSFHGGHRSHYDHYTVYHYYHNKETVPSAQVIRSKDMTECVGDSVEICPGNTTALCTSDGVLMCVVKTTSTVPCKDKKIEDYCFKSTLSCHNNVKDLGCKRYGTTTINIPCMFITKVQGAIKYINNTITPLHKGPPYKVSQKLCVIVVAAPAEKPPTVVELIFDAAMQLTKALIKKLREF